MADMQEFDYTMEVRRVEDGASFGPRPVSRAYLQPGRAQVTFLAQRRGTLGAEATGSEVSVQPVLDGNSADEVTAIRMIVDRGDRSIERQFGLDLFDPVADTLIAELLESKQLNPADKIICRTYAKPAEPATHRPVVTATVKQRPLPLVDGKLDDFLSRATRVGLSRDDDYPVFVSESALEKAHQVSWKGRNAEGGAWLVGRLYRQTAPAEIFAVVDAVLEVRGAVHERFRLDLSPESFTDLNAQLARREKRLGRTGEISLGVYHTHPFLPSILDDREACPECPLQAECDLTSSFFSKKDAQFHAALFGRAAYAIEMVLGLNPREEFDLKMFCPEGGRFRQRGYYRLAEEGVATVAPEPQEATTS